MAHFSRKEFCLQNGVHINILINVLKSADEKCEPHVTHTQKLRNGKGGCTSHVPNLCNSLVDVAEAV